MGLQLAAKCRSTVTLLRVLSSHEQPNVKRGFAALDYLFESAWFLQDARPRCTVSECIELARAEAMAFVSREIPAEALLLSKIRVECRTGDVALEIARFAEEADVDLVVLAAPRPSWGLAILPAPARRVLRLTVRPVVLVRPASRRRAVHAGD
jgi:nucleotide-binding universal stress UspA family protein